jgi:hypothetical protein
MVCKAVVAPQRERLLDSVLSLHIGRWKEASLRARRRTATRESGPCGEVLRDGFPTMRQRTAASTDLPVTVTIAACSIP